MPPRRRRADALRVLVVDTGRSWRGGQQQVVLLARGLARRGVGLLVAAPVSPLGPPLTDAGIETVPFAARSDLDVVAGIRLARIVRAFQPDIIHAHDARAHAMARWVAAFGRSPALIVSRRVTFSPRGRLKYRRGVTRYIAVSNAVRRALTEAGVPPHAIDVVHSAVPVPPGDEQAIRPLKQDSGRPLIAVACALTAEKGVDTVVRAAAQGVEEGLSADWVVWGEGPLRPTLESLAKRLRAPVTFAGPRDDIGPALRTATLLVHASRAEGLGTVILEALARGVPVIATGVGGVSEIVTGDVGSLVQVDDPGAILGEITTWLADPERRAAVHHHGPRISARFDVDSMVNQTIACYERSLAAPVANGKR